MLEDQSKCPKCGREGTVTDVGTASKRRYRQCPDLDNCGTRWMEKNAAAVTLGRLGGMARAAGMTAEQREESATRAGQASKAKRIRVRDTT